MEAKRSYLDRRCNDIKPDRTSYDPHWKELGENILPRSTRFFASTDQNTGRGSKMNGKINDNTATLAVRTLSAGMMSGITSASRPWFNLRTSDPGLNEYKPVKMWLEEVRRILTEVFLKSNVYSTLPEVYSDLGVFGTSAFEMLADEEDGIRCYRYPIGSYYLGTSGRGNVNAVLREYQMKAGQLVETFGRENCSNNVKTAYDRGKYDTWVEVRHLVEPNLERDDYKLDAKFKKFSSTFWEVGNKSGLLRESGFDGFPVIAPRWGLTGEDTYGFSPAMEALGDIKQLQAMQRDKTNIIKKGNTPPMGAPSSLRNQRASLLPGDVTYLDVNQGQQGLVPLYVPNPAWISPLIEDIRECQHRIKRALFEDLFLMISQDERSGVTAREIVERHEEKLQALGPVLERLNDEQLDPMIDRAFSILEDNGMIPPAPPELAQAGLGVEYISTMHQAMKMAGISSIERLARYTGEVGSVFPEALDVFDAEQSVVLMAEALGTAPELTRSPEERAKIRTDRDQRAAMQEQMNMAQQGAQTAQTLSQTQVTEPSALNSMINYARAGVA